MPLLACDGKSEPLALLIPAHRQIVSLERRDAAKLGRLPPVEDRGDDAGSERRQPQEPRQRCCQSNGLLSPVGAGMPNRIRA